MLTTTSFSGSLPLPAPGNEVDVNNCNYEMFIPEIDKFSSYLSFSFSFSFFFLSFIFLYSCLFACNFFCFFAPPCYLTGLFVYSFAHIIVPL